MFYVSISTHLRVLFSASDGSPTLFITFFHPLSVFYSLLEWCPYSWLYLMFWDVYHFSISLATSAAIHAWCFEMWEYAKIKVIYLIVTLDCSSPVRRSEWVIVHSALYICIKLAKNKFKKVKRSISNVKHLCMPTQRSQELFYYRVWKIWHLKRYAIHILLANLICLLLGFSWVLVFPIIQSLNHGALVAVKVISTPSAVCCPRPLRGAVRLWDWLIMCTGLG